MGEVHYISKYTVRPTMTSHNESPHRIELTPWDLKYLPTPYAQRGLLFMKASSPLQDIIHENSVIKLLEKSLSHTLEYFAPFAGRLATTLHNDNTISFFINCNGEGAEFIHAKADITIADILDPLYVPHIVRSFFPLNGLLNHHGLTQPLLAVQVTELFDGFFIGCTFNHMVADGVSLWHFFNSWSEISRGAQHISRPPILNRLFFNEENCPIHLPQSLLEQLSIKKITSSTQVEVRFFHFTQEKIAQLKAKANAEQGTNRISSLQALLAHVWRSVSRSRSLDSDKETCYGMPMNNRPRLHPPLPEEYFGNSTQSGLAKAKVSELLEGGLGSAAWLLNQIVASHTDASVRGYIESWIKKPMLLGMNKMESNILIVASSPRFNVYSNDFGWGRPVAVRGGAHTFDGMIAVFPGLVEGSMDVEVSLLPQTLRAMEDDKEFMESVTILPPLSKP